MHGHGQPVNFKLAGIFHPVQAQGPPDPAIEFAQGLPGKGVLHPQHRHLVGQGGEAGQGLPAHPLGGGIGGAQLRVALLQLHQLLHQAVKFGVADDGVVQDMVAVVVLLDLPPQGGDAFPGLLQFSAIH